MPFMKVVPLEETELFQRIIEGIDRAESLSRLRIVKHKRGYKTLDELTREIERTIELVRKG